MSKARDLADSVSTGGILEDGAVSVSEISDLTVTAAELNTLDGITASTADLNNVAGINSDVQTQLDLKAPLASPTFTGDATFDTDTLVVDSTNNRVGIGTSSPNRSLEVYNASAQAPMRVESGQGTAYIDFKTSGTTADFKVGLGAINDDAYFRAGGTERMRIDSSGNVGIGATNSSVFNGVGGNSRIVAKGSDTATNVVNNSNASITIANDDGTANNLAGLHFARADTDDNPHYAGASIVAQFPIAQVTGQYPQGQLVFLTSTSQNAAPSEKLRISPEGAVGIGGANYGTAGQVLTSGGSGAAPTWADAAAGGAAFSAF